jgi:hypothetical protein
MQLIILCGFGIGAFFWGFTCLRRKRLIENIPTSTVRGMALGLMELIGKAEKKTNIISPLEGVECVFYRYKVERYKKSGRSGSWVTLAKGDSCDSGFYLDDGTGTVLVAPKGAELILPLDYEYVTNFGSGMPVNLIRFMEKHNLRYGNFLGTYKLRFREWRICNDETVYVLGTAQKSQNFLSEHEIQLAQRIEALKQDSKKLEECDLNKDGDLSMEEWDLAKVRIEQELLEKELKSSQAGELIDIIIGKGDTEKIFIISDNSQKGLIDKLFWQSIFGIFGGAILAVVTLVFLLRQMGIINFRKTEGKDGGIYTWNSGFSGYRSCAFLG